MRCGVWIDLRQAIIVTLKGDEATERTFLSDVDSRQRAGGSAGMTAKGRKARGRGGPSVPGPEEAFAEDRLDRRYAQELRRYYRRVARALDRAEAIFVMGPGQAPGELMRVLEEDPEMASRVIGVDPADKMTLPQVVAHVRRVFGEELPRRAGGAGVAVRVD